jgi:hypothetical protein
MEAEISHDWMALRKTVIQVSGCLTARCLHTISWGQGETSTQQIAFFQSRDHNLSTLAGGATQ